MPPDCEPSATSWRITSWHELPGYCQLDRANSNVELGGGENVVVHIADEEQTSCFEAFVEFLEEEHARGALRLSRTQPRKTERAISGRDLFVQIRLGAKMKGSVG